MAGSSSGGDEEISGINVTPLVDIMLVLLIILMVTAEFTKYRTVPVQLPKVNAATMKREPQKVSLTIRADGLYLNDKKVERANLQQRLKQAKAAQPEIAVILRAEGKTDYQEVLSLLDQVKESGISKVGLAVDSARAGQ